MKDYNKFLESKKEKAVESGFNIELNQLNDSLFDFQKHIVKKAILKGRYAIFADCGLGKTFMQIEWARLVAENEEKPVLILAPLAVSQQTIREGLKFGIDVKNVSMFDGLSNNGIYITNYEQIDNLDCSAFCGVVLDESSILKNFEGKTKNLIIDKFQNTKYKLACTATPSPNDPMELGNHSEFLNRMSRNEMLSMYFVHDGGQTAKWRLKGHSKKDFWSYISSFAVMLGKPSDIGFDNKGYDLPDLNIIDHLIETEKKENGLLFNDVAVSATDYNQELRRTIDDRLTKVADLVNSSTDSFIVWIKQNAEGDYLRKLIPGAIEVRGSDKPEIKEKHLLGFADGDFRVLITKTKIAQFGLNYQNCHNQIFASLDFSFEGLYQAIRRSYRFGQKENVNIHLITLDTMVNVKNNIDIKKKQFEEMQTEMTKSINEHKDKQVNSATYEEFTTDNYTIVNGDSVKLIDKLDDESIGFSIFSPPFAELYTYSDDVADMGNSKNYEEFLFAFDILISKLYNKMKQGRNVAVHCMDLPIQKGKEGFIGLRDFSGMILDTFRRAGFIYHSRVTIWKDPVVEMQRTKALGLLHKQVKKDSTMSRVGIPDYLMVFRKDGDRDDPVRCTIDVDTWQKFASPIWYDINYSKTLNSAGSRTENDEKHICPLQLETIERAVTLWSNEGDTVFTPFCGIGSEVYQSVKMNRKGIGFELKNSYFKKSIENMKSLEDDKKQFSLF